jgi:ABC-type phosphate transport system auxiliary subunit
MKRISRITLLLAVVTVGFAAGRAAADEPNDKPKPGIAVAEKVRRQSAKAARTFGSLLQKGQTVTLYQFGQELQYQVRIVNDDQKKQIEDVVARNAKQLDDYNNKRAELEEQLLETYVVTRVTSKIKEPERHAELRTAIDELQESFKSTSLPTDIRSAKFHTISDVGSDYVGFERNGVETFHRLSSIQRIIRGVEIVEE